MHDHNTIVKTTVLFSLLFLLFTGNKLLAQADSTRVLSSLSGTTINNTNTDQPIDIIYSDIPNFEIDENVLKSGDIQAYTMMKDTNALDETQKQFLQKIDILNMFKNSSRTKISLTHFLFVVPGKTAANFSPGNITQKQYINKIYYKTNFIKSFADENASIILECEKDVPVSKNVITTIQFLTATPKFISNNNKSSLDTTLSNKIISNYFEKLGLPDRIVLSLSMKSSDPILVNSMAINTFFDLPDNSGVLVIRTILASLDFNQAPFLKKKLLEKIPTKFWLETFENEMIYMVRNIRDFTF